LYIRRKQKTKHMSKTTKAANLPAYPPQLLQDNFGRLVAPVPGMSMRERVALAILPNIMHLGGMDLIEDEISLAFKYADKFCERIDQDAEKTGPETLQIVT
jgi:hypothetical protein